MAEESLKSKTFKGIVWSSVERFSVQGVQFLVMLVIARILDPKDFGLVGMLAIFLAVAQSLIDSGFSQALIKKQNRTEVDNNTVFYFNIVVSAVLYLILYAIIVIDLPFYVLRPSNLLMSHTIYVNYNPYCHERYKTNKNSFQLMPQKVYRVLSFWLFW